MLYVSKFLVIAKEMKSKQAIDAAVSLDLIIAIRLNSDQGYNNYMSQAKLMRPMLSMCLDDP